MLYNNYLCNLISGGYDWTRFGKSEWGEEEGTY